MSVLYANPTGRIMFFGDARYAFCLGTRQIEEVERIADAGIGTVFQRLIARQFYHRDLLAVIRLALIGGGTAPEAAERRVSVYGEGRPIGELYSLAVDILGVLFGGSSVLDAPDAGSAPEAAA